MPLHNFSWVIPGKLAGSAIPGGTRIGRSPTAGADLADLRAQGIRTLVSVQEMPRWFGEECRKAQLEWIQFPIKDFEVPEDGAAFSALVNRIIALLKKETPVCVHCHAGVGRTGLVLACVLGRMFGLDGKKAIAAVRRARTALETDDQIKFVRDFCRSE
jgi:atypical dual specificity phosphatase